MKNLYINIFTTALILFCATAYSQTISTFENITLTTDTFKNGSDWSRGFTSGNATFVNHYDTSFGFTSWDGFSVSNKRDTITAGYTNQYSSVTGTGYQSANYAVGYYSSYSPSPMRIKLNGAAKGKQVSGFYITNSAYSYLAMKNGIPGVNKKFGGAIGNDPDWFMLKIKGYVNGHFTIDSVNFYMADFRFADNSKDYFVKTWTWLDLSKLGNVDSIEFTMSSSDTAGGFGMNNPSYFCLDNFTTRDAYTGLPEAKTNANSFVVYPNPANEYFIVESTTNESEITIYDVTGKIILNQVYFNAERFSVSNFHKGIYFLEMKSGNVIQTKKLIIE